MSRAVIELATSARRDEVAVGFSLLASIDHLAVLADRWSHRLQVSHHSADYADKVSYVYTARLVSAHYTIAAS